MLPRMSASYPFPTIHAALKDMFVHIAGYSGQASPSSLFALDHTNRVPAWSLMNWRNAFVSYVLFELGVLAPLLCRGKLV